MTVTSTPKIKDDSFFDDYSVIQQYQAEKQLINESNNRSRGRSRSRKEDNTVTQKSKVLPQKE
jgi:hypothetical protein